MLCMELPLATVENLQLVPDGAARGLDGGNHLAYIALISFITSFFIFRFDSMSRFCLLCKTQAGVFLQLEVGSFDSSDRDWAK